MANKPYPYLIFRPIDQIKSTYPLQVMPLVNNLELNLSKSEVQYCIGYESHRGSWDKCPFNSHIKGISSYQCGHCQKLEFYSCRKTCQGFKCNPKTLEAKALCDINETVLYLTYIGRNPKGKNSLKDLFKVGVSLNPLRRWVEQGSFFSAQLWKGNGLKARLYEQQLGAQLGLRLSVQLNNKLKQIGRYHPLESKISKKIEMIIKKIKKLDLFPLDPLSNQIFNLTTYYGGIPTLTRQPILDNNHIKGKVIGVLGQILVMQDRNSFYAVNLKKIISFVWTPHKSESSKPRQRSLFDF
jgi:hypothetical protein